MFPFWTGFQFFISLNNFSKSYMPQPIRTHSHIHTWYGNSIFSVISIDVPSPSSERSSEMEFMKKVLLYSAVSVGAFLVIVILVVSFFVIKKNKKRSQYERINDVTDDETQRAAWLEGGLHCNIIESIFLANPQFQIDGKEITQGSRIGKGR